MITATNNNVCLKKKSKVWKLFLIKKIDCIVYNVLWKHFLPLNVLLTFEKHACYMSFIFFLCFMYKAYKIVLTFDIHGKSYHVYNHYIIKALILKDCCVLFKRKAALTLITYFFPK